MENNAFGDSVADSPNAFGDVAVLDDAPPAPPPAPRVPVEALFQGVDKIGEGLPLEARRQLDEQARTESDPKAFKTQIAITAFLADRYQKPIEEVASQHEKYRDDFAREQLHELAPLDDAQFYGKIGAKLEREKNENVMLQQMAVGLFHSLRAGEMFGPAYEAFRKANIGTNPGWDAYRQDYYRQFSKKTWDTFTASKERLKGPIEAVSAYMERAKRGPSAADSGEGVDAVHLMQARDSAVATLRALPDNEAAMVMDFAASQAAKDTAGDPEKGFLDTVSSRIKRGIGDFAKSAAGAVEDLGRHFMDPASAAADRRDVQLERQLDQRVRGEVDPMKGHGWIANEALDVAEGMPRFASAFSLPGIVVQYVATKEELRASYEDQGLTPGNADILSGLAAVPQTALNFVSSKMALGVVPGGKKLIGEMVGTGLVPVAKQVGKYLVAESLIQPVLQGGANLAPSALQSIAAQFDESVPGIPGGFLKQAELVAKSTPETFTHLIPFILLGSGMGTFHDRASAKTFLQDGPRLTALGVTEETKAAVLAAPTPEAAAAELQKGFPERTASPEQKAALAELDAQALKSRAAHGETFTPDQADLFTKYKGTFGMIEPGHLPVEILRADGKTVPAAFAGWGEKPDANGVPQPFESIAYLTAEGWQRGTVREGDKLLTPVPSPEEWAAGVRKGEPLLGPEHIEGDNPNPEDPTDHGTAVPFVSEEELMTARTQKQWERVAGSVRAIDKKLHALEVGDTAAQNKLLLRRLELQAEVGLPKAVEALSRYHEQVGLRAETPSVEAEIRKYVEKHPLVIPGTEGAKDVQMHGELTHLHESLTPAQRKRAFRKAGETNLGTYAENLVEHLQAAGHLPEGDAVEMASSMMGGEAGVLEKIQEAYQTDAERIAPGFVDHPTKENFDLQERIKVTRAPDDSFIVTGHHGDILGTAASAEGAAAIVHEQGLAEDVAPTEIRPAESKLLDELSKIPGAETSIADKIRAQIKESQKLGFVQNFAGFNALRALGYKAGQVFKEFATFQRFTPLKQLLGEWGAKRALAQLEISALVRNIKKVAPDRSTRDGITNWIQAAGDRAILQERYEASTKAYIKDGYKAALNLNPDQIRVAEIGKQYYAEKLAEGRANGILEKAVENYVTQIWDIPSPFSKKGGSPFRGMLSQNFKFAQEREFGSFFEGEQADYTPKTKDFAELLAIYSNEMSKVIATRELIKDLTTRKGTDGRPGAHPVGAASESEGDGSDKNLIQLMLPGEELQAEGGTGEGAAKTKLLVKPMTKGAETLDFETINHPALSQWKWVATVEGKQVMLQGQLGLHPEIFKYVKNALGRSEIKRWYESDSHSLTVAAAKAFISGIDRTLSYGKATSLGGISTFHLAHEVKRVSGNRVNPFDLPKLDYKDPMLKRALESTLQIVGDNEAMNQFQEGLGGRSAVDYVPGLGKVSRAVSEFTFHEFIPRAKFKLWGALVERNSSLYAKELQEGTISQKDVDYMSAQQANARLGHLNLVDLGRNPTLKHIMSSVLLAPDFLESNLRNYGQVAKGLVSKGGREPLAAFALTAAVVFMASRVLNQLLDHDPHLEEPFGVVHNNRVYTMRNEVEDLWRATHNPRGYVSGRISSFTRLLTGLLSGTNWRGEKQSAFDTFKDFLAGQTPMSMSGLPVIRDLTETGRNSRLSTWQAILSSQGVQVAGRSKINDAYKVAGAYYREHGGKEDRGVYPTSRYQQLRYALEDGDEKKARAQIEKLMKETPEPARLRKGFLTSLNHPFTGSKAMDEQMLQELKGDDLKHVQDAVELRANLAEEFNRLMDEKD